MSVLMAPWTPAMRLGQGFNSFTHELCIDNAVKVKNDAKDRAKTPSQTVTYSARVVDKLSEVMESMNLSYSASIKKGTVETSGNSTTVDETSFKNSDLNAVVSVKVINETVSLDDGCQFIPMKNVLPGSAKFNEVYGDCYISGYVEGGEFTSIISVKVLNEGKKDEVIKSIKSAFGDTTEEEMTFETLPAGISSSMRDRMDNTETAVSVSWTGGGKIKEESAKWDLATAMQAAAAFPTNVGKCPQRTYAILTKYKANRSFVEQASESLYKALDYDHVGSFTAELFDNYMDYKLLIKTVQNIIVNKDHYEIRRGTENAIDTQVKTLIGLRSILREEQGKIVEAVEVISKNPGILRRQSRGMNVRRAPVVNSIVKDILGDMAFEPYRFETPAIEEAPAPKTADDKATDSSAAVATKPTEAAATADKSAVADTTKAAPTTQATASTVSFNFDALIPPEIWEDLLPVRKVDPVAAALTAGSTGGVAAAFVGITAAQFPPPPDNYIFPNDARLSQTHSQQIAQASKEKDDALNKAREAKANEDRAVKEAEASRRERDVLNADLTSKMQVLEQQKRALNQDFATANAKANELEAQVRQLQAATEAAKKSAASSEQALNAQRDRTRELEQNATVLQNRVQNLEKVSMPKNPNSRVTILCVNYGGDFFMDYVLRPNDNSVAWIHDKLIMFATNQQKFQVTNNFFGDRDPMSGQRKCCVITYRYDDGRIRWLSGREGEWIKFDNW